MLYNNLESGTVVVALILLVEVKFALIFPKFAKVVNLIVESTSPNILTVNVFDFVARTVSGTPPSLVAFTVNLYS